MTDIMANLFPYGGSATSTVPSTGMSLYIHVPFCQTKCPYCDFNTYQGIENLMESYLQALTTELGLWGKVLGHPTVTTVFFGGGTPSYLPEGFVLRILDAARATFEVRSDAEMTVEANPGDLRMEASQRLLAEGVNRLSIGVQSLDNDLLSMLGRRHDAVQAVAALQSARVSGFRNVNLDLMYGLPNQTLVQWHETLGQLVLLEPEHVSLYALTLEEGTPMQRWIQQGKLPEPDPDLAADMYHHAEEVLAAAGYHHYEISNWSLPGFPSRHNLAYWRLLPYLGVGPGAHSQLGEYRFWNTSSPRLYFSQVRRWKESQPQAFAPLTAASLEGVFPVAGNEHIDRATACAETMFLGLRLLDGMDLAAASDRVGLDLEAKYGTEIDGLISLGLLERSGVRLRLTQPAYLIANQVFTRFLG